MINNRNSRNRDTYYSGRNPVYSGNGTSYDPIQMEREKGLRTNKDMEGLIESAEIFYDKDDARRKETMGSIPENGNFFSSAINERVGQDISNLQKEVVSTMADTGLIFDFTEKAALEQKMAEVQQKTDDWTVADKLLNKRIVDYTKNRKNFDVDVTDYRLRKLEKDIKAGTEGALDIDVPNLFVYKGTDIDKFTDDIIKTSQKLREEQTKYDLSTGGTGATTYKWNDAYTDKQGYPLKEKIIPLMKKALAGDEGDGMRTTIGMSLLKSGDGVSISDKEENENLNEDTYGLMLKKAFYDGEINPLGYYSDDDIVNEWYRQKSGSFSNNSIKSLVDNSIKSLVDKSTKSTSSDKLYSYGDNKTSSTKFTEETNTTGSVKTIKGEGKEYKIEKINRFDKPVLIPGMDIEGMWGKSSGGKILTKGEHLRTIEVMNVQEVQNSEFSDVLEKYKNLRGLLIDEEKLRKKFYGSLAKDLPDFLIEGDTGSTVWAEANVKVDIPVTGESNKKTDKFKSVTITVYAPYELLKERIKEATSYHNATGYVWDDGVNGIGKKEIPNLLE